LAVLKCLICGRTCLPGAKLCSDCSSARKRAFAATVTQPLLAAAGVRSERSLLRPSQSVAATVRRSAEQRARTVVAPAEVSVAGVSKQLEWMIVGAALTALALIVAIVAWHRHVAGSADHTPVAEAEGTRVVPAPATTLVPPELAPKSVAEVPPPLTHDAMPEGESVTPPKADPARRPAAKAKPVAEPQPAIAEPPPPAVAVAPAPVPTPAPREVPPPDPLQQMRDALAQCSGGVFDRILCDQRVRREYCEGRWGQVPQCSSGLSTDHGQ
jgi:hypothetical protein